MLVARTFEKNLRFENISALVAPRTVIDKFARNWISQKSAFTLHFTLKEVKKQCKEAAPGQIQTEYVQATKIKQQSSPRSKEAERVSTYRTLAWFSSPAMLRVTRARWITIDSRQNRIECHYEDLFLYTHYVLKVLTWLFISDTQGVSVLLLKSA